VPDLKEHGFSVSISSLISIFTLGGMGWFFLQPIMVAQISTAMAEDMEQAIEDKTEPIQSAFKVLLLKDINQLKRVIATLEYKEEHEPDEWTERDAQRLTDKYIELEAFQEAYADL